jgi:hypothetical protein
MGRLVGFSLQGYIPLQESISKINSQYNRLNSLFRHNFYHETNLPSCPSRTTHIVIDPPFVCSYNTIMKMKFAGFFRPDHDPPQNGFPGSAPGQFSMLVVLELTTSYLKNVTLSASEGSLP